VTLVIVLLWYNTNLKMKPSDRIWIGTSGLVLTEPNKKAFPTEFQDGHRLIYYASKYNSIEINSSFYKMPRGATCQKWSEMVPENFRFTMKLWRGISHEMEAGYQDTDLEIFLRAINCLGKKKGCLLIQFPASANFQINLLLKLLQSLRRMDPDGSWRIAVEFRHPRWYHADLYAILDEYNASLVLHDMPNSIPVKPNDKPPFIYLRFHGEKGDYRGSYDRGFLQQKAKDIRRWLDGGREVFVYFNNTIGAAASNGQTLMEMLG
jgi:uncharacterized protein YecE (DUF72 family)